MQAASKYSFAGALKAILQIFPARAARKIPRPVLGTILHFHENLKVSGLLCDGFHAGEFRDLDGRGPELARELGTQRLFVLEVSALQTPVEVDLESEESRSTHSVLVLPIKNGKIDLDGPLLELQWMEAGRFCCLSENTRVVIERKARPELLDALKICPEDTRSAPQLAAMLMPVIQEAAEEARDNYWQPVRRKAGLLADRWLAELAALSQELGLPVTAPTINQFHNLEDRILSDLAMKEEEHPLPLSYLRRKPDRRQQLWLSCYPAPAG